MSLVTREFYAIQCDFPDCGELAEGYEDSTYWWEPYQGQEYAEESGWIVDSDNGIAFCEAHTVEAECEDGDCGHDWSEHRKPLADTWLNRLRLASDKRTRATSRELDHIEYRLADKHGALGVYGANARKTDAALSAIWEHQVRNLFPDATPQDMHDFRMEARS